MTTWKTAIAAITLTGAALAIDAGHWDALTWCLLWGASAINNETLRRDLERRP